VVSFQNELKMNVNGRGLTVAFARASQDRRR